MPPSFRFPPLREGNRKLARFPLLRRGNLQRGFQRLRVDEAVVAAPKVYIPGRTRTTLEYTVGRTRLIAENQQLETDLVLEYQGTVTILEAKNRFLSNFAVYQLFHPIKHYHQRAKAKGIQVPHLNACYVLKQARRKDTRIRMYLYEFSDLDRIDSIRLVRKAEYRLRVR